MKTKIIYISGNEVFDMADIRAAFEEVRCALNLDKDTVLFGVPVDTDDAGLTATEQSKTIIEEKQPEEIIDETPQEIIEEEIPEETETPVVEQPKKRGRPRKEETVIEETSEKVIEEPATEAKSVAQEEKVIPILSVLSNQDSDEKPVAEEIEIISEISAEEPAENPVIEETQEEQIEDSAEEDEADLEKLLSAMTPLQEDVLETKEELEQTEPIAQEPEDASVDATLEQLATEFAETQDKIATENKSSTRSKIGKLRNILPFKQSKHKDQGLGDLFGWAGVAANDEDFSVPGFFTNAASKH